MSKNTQLGNLVNGIFVDSTGKVGVGTQSPTVPLDVVGAGRFSGELTGTSAVFSSNVTATLQNSTNKEGFIVKATTTSAGGSQPAYTYYTAAGSKRWASFLNVGDDKYHISNASNTELFTITQAGNFGIGTTSPSSALHVVGGSTGGGSTIKLTSKDNLGDNWIGFYQNDGTRQGYLGYGYSSNNAFEIYQESNEPIIISTNATERMRITSGGNVLMGTSSDNGYRLRVSGGMYANSLYLQQTAANGGGTLTLANNDTFADSAQIVGQINFYNTDNDIPGVSSYVRGYTGSNYGVGGQLGFGTQNTWSSGNLVTRMFIDNYGNIGAPSGTNIYNASDRRLKRNISSIQDGLSKILALNPVKFNWVEKFVKAEDEKDMLGFIAQEVLPHIPEAVESFGESDLLVDGVVIDNPLRINEKFIIPVLVKAIQELSAEITLLKNK